jgi:hypothetical protein
MRELRKSITLDNGATLTFTLIASWHDMRAPQPRERGNGRKEGRKEWENGEKKTLKVAFPICPLGLPICPRAQYQIEQ